MLLSKKKNLRFIGPAQTQLLSRFYSCVCPSRSPIGPLFYCIVPLLFIPFKKKQFKPLSLLFMKWSSEGTCLFWGRHSDSFVQCSSQPNLIYFQSCQKRKRKSPKKIYSERPHFLTIFSLFKNRFTLIKNS